MANFAIVNVAGRITTALGTKAPPIADVIAWLETLLSILGGCYPTPAQAFAYLRDSHGFRRRRIRKELHRQSANILSLSTVVEDLCSVGLVVILATPQPVIEAAYLEAGLTPSKYADEPSTVDSAA